MTEIIDIFLSSMKMHSYEQFAIERAHCTFTEGFRKKWVKKANTTLRLIHWICDLLNGMNCVFFHFWNNISHLPNVYFCTNVESFYLLKMGKGGRMCICKAFYLDGNPSFGISKKMSYPNRIYCFVAYIFFFKKNTQKVMKFADRISNRA